MRTLFLLLLVTGSFFVCALRPACAATGFAGWLADFKVEAAAAGVDRDTLDHALSDVKRLDWIIKLDRNQPEFTKTLQQYLADQITAARIRRGQQLLEKHRALFNKVYVKYQVPPKIILALWAIETGYGQHTGKVPVIDALATLAYDKRRSAYFRRELLTACQLLDRDLVSLSQLRGSWAGAMGNFQFMPSSFLRYGVDGNRDGQIDLWTEPEDYLPSAAHYLESAGWDHRYIWGRKVRLPDHLAGDYFGLQRQLPLAKWRQLGVRKADGTPLADVQIKASLIRPDGSKGDTFLVYDNYRVLLKWNRAHRFALAVGLLADAIGR